MALCSWAGLSQSWWKGTMTCGWGNSTSFSDEIDWSSHVISTNTFYFEDLLKYQRWTRLPCKDRWQNASVGFNSVYGLATGSQNWIANHLPYFCRVRSESTQIKLSGIRMTTQHKPP